MINSDLSEPPRSKLQGITSLRLLQSTYDFINNYLENVKKYNTIQYEHKSKWNEIISQQQNNLEFVYNPN